MDNSGGVERVKPFPSVLQYEQFCLVFYVGNVVAKAILTGPKATKTSLGIGKLIRFGLHFSKSAVRATFVVDYPEISLIGL